MPRFPALLIALVLLLSPLVAAGGAGAGAFEGQDLAAFPGSETVELRGHPTAPRSVRWGSGERRLGAGGNAPAAAPLLGSSPPLAGCRGDERPAPDPHGCRPLAEQLPYDANAPPPSRKG
jgi:hypothetical protein